MTDEARAADAVAGPAAPGPPARGRPTPIVAAAFLTVLLLAVPLVAGGTPADRDPVAAGAGAASPPDSIAAGDGAGLPPDSPDSLVCVLATWTADALGRRAAGAAVWVEAPDGALRLDLAAATEGAAPEGCDAVLARAGEGWTLVADGVGPGVFGAWDREWRAAPDGWTDLARAVADCVRPGGAAGRTLVLAAAPVDPDAAADRSAGRAGVPAVGFRGGLARRGRGGGGPGERVAIRPAAGGVVRVTSSRRPGALTVRPVARLAAGGDAAEVFLPWWPLGEVLRLPDSDPAGTSGSTAR